MKKIDKRIKGEMDSLLANLETIREGLRNSASLIAGSVKNLQSLKVQLNSIVREQSAKQVVNNIIDSNITSNLINLNLYKETVELINILTELIENAIKFDDDENNKGDEKRRLKNREEPKYGRKNEKILE